MPEWNDHQTTLATVSAAIGRFLRERDWERFHTPKNLAMSIAIEAAELMEIFQWVSSDEAMDHALDPQQLEHVQEEVADVVIYCISLARALNFDLAAALQDKIAKNAVKYPAANRDGALVPAHEKLPGGCD